MDLVTVIKETPIYAQGIARTLLQNKRVDLASIVHLNTDFGVDSQNPEQDLVRWLVALQPLLNEDEESLTAFLSQIWQVRRLQPKEWQYYLSTAHEQSKSTLPKALREVPQGIVFLGTLGVGLPKLGILDASDAQVMQRLAFIFHDHFEWRVLSVGEYNTIQDSLNFNSRFAMNTVVTANADLGLGHADAQTINRAQTTYSPSPSLAGAGMPSLAQGLPSTQSVSSVQSIQNTQGMDANDAPIVRYLQDLLNQMVNERASDVHFEPYAESFRIRARVDGVLHEVDCPDVRMKEQLLVRLKIMAQLDIAEKRLPQDGRIKLTLDTGATVDCRVSTLPTVFGEKVVVRFLNVHNAALSLDGLGLEPSQLEWVSQTLQSPHGMVLMTGPTGSGKTVSLYACLNALNHEGVNISTVEDPVEIYMHGVNQVSVNEKAGIHFATALRAFLRQDPDILMVGEIRDLDTADIAVKAAQTGHLVFSTLHTNDATMALTRLNQMGVTAYNVAASVRLIVAQRLVRQLCSCKQPVHLNEALLQSAGLNAAQAAQTQWQAYAPVGCALCHHTGYSGRVGVFQVVPVSAALQTLIAQNASAQQLQAQASSEGHLTLRQAGLLKVMAGLSSLDEVMSVTL